MTLKHGSFRRNSSAPVQISVRLTLASILLTLLARSAPFIPPYTDGFDDKVIYNAIEMPDKNLSKSVTKGLFKGRFWVDGVTSIATDSDGEQYLWIYSTVHSPQLPKRSLLSWFAQFGQVARKEEEDKRRRQLQQQTIISAFSIDTDVSSFVCQVKYDYDA